MNQELISIIVPIYDIEDCLPRCIESLMAQTYENIEILLINDGSPDNSGAICEAYTQRDPRVKYFYKPNGGLSSARNFGLDQVQGEYICFVDGDDFMDKRMVEILYSEIRKHHVIYNREAGSTTIEYYAIAPHEWILDQMRKRSG